MLDHLNNRRSIWLMIPFLGGSLALLEGCSNSNEEPSVERHVENGIEVVLSRAAAWGPDGAWRLSDIPMLQIGNDESLGGDYVFSGVSGAMRTPDGRIVVADRFGGELRFFNSEGTLLQLVGGHGRGPGEFAWIFNLLRCDDNALHAVGPDTWVSIFDLRGSFRERVYPAEKAGIRIGYSFVCDRDGRLVVTDRHPERVGIEGLYRSIGSISLLDLDADGGVIAEFGSFPIQERLAGFGGSSPHPLGKQTSMAISGGRIYIGTADRYEIAVFNEAGALVQRIRRETQVVSLDERAVARYLETWVETVPTDDRELMLRRFSGAEHPEAYPAYRRFIVDELGYLWVEGFSRTFGAPSTWSVFTADGVWLGDLQMPPNFHVLEIGEDYVLGRFTDELGVESVGVYALER